MPRWVGLLARPAVVRNHLRTNPIHRESSTRYYRELFGFLPHFLGIHRRKESEVHGVGIDVQTGWAKDDPARRGFPDKDRIFGPRFFHDRIIRCEFVSRRGEFLEPRGDAMLLVRVDGAFIDGYE